MDLGEAESDGVVVGDGELLDAALKGTGEELGRLEGGDVNSKRELNRFKETNFMKDGTIRLQNRQMIGRNGVETRGWSSKYNRREQKEGEEPCRPERHRSA